MTDAVKPLRWKDHSLFPYTCKGCGTKHPKGDGVYLDQSGTRTVTYDIPECAQQGASGEGVRKNPEMSRPTVLPAPQAVAPSVSTAVDGQDHTDEVSLMVNHDGRSVEVLVKIHGKPVTKPTVDRLVTDVSRMVLEDLS